MGVCREVVLAVYRLICMPYMYALYVCLICMPYIQVGVCREGVLAACWLAISLGVFLRDTLGYLDAHAASRASDSPQRELYLAAKKADVEEVRACLLILILILM